MGIRYSTPVKNPPWDVLHATDRGQKEAECMYCWGHWGSTLGPNLQANPSAIEIGGIGHPIKKFETSIKAFTCYKGYWASLLVGTSWEGGWSKISILPWKIGWHMRGYPATTGEGSEPEEEQPRLHRWEMYEEALRVACKRVLDTAEAHQGDMERLSWRTRDRSWTCSWTHSWSCSRSHSRSRIRSHSRACSQSHSWNSSQSRQPWSPDGPPCGRSLTFREPVEDPNSEGNVEGHTAEPSVSNVEMWLEWQAKQLGTPTWWPELKAILGVKDAWKLSCKIWASFYIPEVRMRPLLGQEYTAPPAPKCLSRNAFLLDELSYQDVQQQPTLLMVAYTRGLQYWAEKLKLSRSPDLCPLPGSVVELRETVQEHVTFNHWDVVQCLGVIHLGSTSWWPQTTLFSHVLSLPVEGEDFMETTTHTTSSAAEEGTTRCATPPSETEKENCYLLVITASVGQLNLGPQRGWSQKIQCWYTQ